jgi:hypothetical protein
MHGGRSQACERLGLGSSEVVAGAVEGLIAGMGFIDLSGAERS